MSRLQEQQTIITTSTVIRSTYMNHRVIGHEGATRCFGLDLLHGKFVLTEHVARKRLRAVVDKINRLS